MEVRISRILSEHYGYTRKEAEEYIRQARVTCNGEVVIIGDKATVTDQVELDGVRIPLKGVFRAVERESAGREVGARYRSHPDDEEREHLNAKSKDLRKGRKNEFAKRKGKNTMY